MKVALVVWKLFPSFVGGTERHSRELANSLASLGATIDVICAEIPPGDDPRRLPFRIVPVGWQNHVPNLVAEWIFSRRAARHIAGGNYDVAYGQNLALWQYVGRKHLPCVMNPHGLEPMKVRGWWARPRGSVRRRAFRYTAQHSDVVVSLGGRLSQDLEQLLQINPAQVVCLPNGVDLNALDRQRIRGTPRMPESFLCVGRLADNKGVDVLLDAFRILAGRCGARLYVIGDGPLRAKLTRALPQNVVLLGRQSNDELTSWYQRAEALILPSLYEGMPTVVLEAMGFGLPVIATDVGAVATLVDRDNGFLVPPGSSQALAEAVRRFTNLDQDVKLGLGARSREKVETLFTWPEIARQTLSLLDRLARGATPNA
jgi:glycosyltransferase involved in cell wall biosynthesis